MGMSNKEAVRKAVTDTTIVGAGGILNTEQSRVFIETVRESTALTQIVRTVSMGSSSMEIDKVGIGSRIARAMAENDTTHVNYLRSPQHGKITLTAKKYGLPWALTEEVIEDNIEGESYEDRVARLMASQFGLDIEDLGINGDTVYSGAAPTATMTTSIDGTTDPIDVVCSGGITGFPRTGTSGYIQIESELLKYETVDTATNTFKNCARAQNGTTIASHTQPKTVTWVRHGLIGDQDGWLKKMYSGGANYLDLSAINTGDIEKGHFFQIMRNLPSQYRRGGALARLRWLMSVNQASIWREYLTNRGTPAGDAPLVGNDVGAMRPLGVPIVTVPSLPDDTIVLTDPMNLILGIRRRIKVKSTDMALESVMQDLRYYNVTMRLAFQLEEVNAVSFGDGLNA